MADTKELKKKKIPVRSGVFVGAYVPKDVKDVLRKLARSQHCNLSDLVRQALTDKAKEYKEK